MSLPLGLAVALLKDPDGRIDLDVPVRGDLDDPEFKYGTVVRKALVNLLTRIVTAPFALLGNLVGAEAGELEYLVFEPGRSDLSPPELEKAGKIAEALALRPKLALQIGGVYVPESDAAALKAEKVGTDPAAILEETRNAHTTLADDGKKQFDALAYTEALRSRLIDAQPLGEEELLSLGAARADNVRRAILESSAELGSRITVDQSVAVAIDDNNRVRMKLTLQVQ
jgi:hypothetical protein